MKELLGLKNKKNDLQGVYFSSEELRNIMCFGSEDVWWAVKVWRKRGASSGDVVKMCCVDTKGVLCRE